MLAVESCIRSHLQQYDLTYSFSIGGEHATTVNGNGKNPSLNDILEVAKNIGIKNEEALTIANNIKKIVEKNLNIFLKKNSDTI